ANDIPDISADTNLEINTDDNSTVSLAGLFTLSATGSYYNKANQFQPAFISPPANTFTSLHQQDLRLMLSSESNNISYEIHSLTSASQSDYTENVQNDSSHLFQFNKLKYDFIDQDTNTTYSGYTKLDRFNFKINYRNYDFRVGRQAISWGNGRLWQPTDIFGAFTANELVRDYKPGIDVIDFNFYPDSFSNINIVYAFSSNNALNSGLRYTRPLSETVFLSIIAAQIEKNIISGGSLESDWLGAGIRMESIISFHDDTYNIFSVIGMDYQFSSRATDRTTYRSKNNSLHKKLRGLLNEWLLTLELYYNDRGANQSADISTVIDNKLFQAGLLKQLSQKLLGLSMQKNVTPLISVNYLWITAILKDKTERTLSHESSSLHQLSAVYSISNESALRFTLLSTSGNGLNKTGIPQSEFGHIPLTATISFRLYF
ncbi:MAG: hypothetical protein OEX07_01215, partial [Gammaproteobacteria bacterium]|nr:hypothetical protein [Gammaproteobacteria bacterium]